MSSGLYKQTIPGFDVHWGKSVVSDNKEKNICRTTPISTPQQSPWTNLTSRILFLVEIWKSVKDYSSYRGNKNIILYGITPILLIQCGPFSHLRFSFFVDRSSENRLKNTQVIAVISLADIFFIYCFYICGTFEKIIMIYCWFLVTDISAIFWWIYPRQTRPAKGIIKCELSSLHQFYIKSQNSTIYRMNLKVLQQGIDDVIAL